MKFSNGNRVIVTKGSHKGSIGKVLSFSVTKYHSDSRKYSNTKTRYVVELDDESSCSFDSDFIEKYNGVDDEREVADFARYLRFANVR